MASTGVRRSRWSPDDERLLLRLRQEHPFAAWEKVSILFAVSNPQHARSPNAIKIKFKSLMQPSLAKARKQRAINARATNSRATNSRATNPRATNTRPTKFRSVLSKDRPRGLGLYVWNEKHSCYEEFPPTYSEGGVSRGTADYIPQPTGSTSISAWGPRNPADIRSYVLPYPSEIIDHLRRPAPMIFSVTANSVQIGAGNNVNAVPRPFLPPFPCVEIASTSTI
jgi:hypothetical protein